MNSGRPVPVWFGPDESPLFGVLHIPEAPTRGAIVLCPPLGREYVYSHSTFVKLATDLARLGLAAFRFDYRSTGDSFDRVADDLNRGGFGHDVRLAVEFVRTLGVAHVGIVGMRLGANFAGLQRGCEPVDAMVMWDPCPTGRSFLREQRALGLFGGVLTAEDANTIDLPGFELSSEMSKEISALDLTEGQLGPVAAGGLADRVLLLTRSERSADREIVEGFDLAHVEHREVASPCSLTCTMIGRSSPLRGSRRSQNGWTRSWLTAAQQSWCQPKVKLSSGLLPAVRALERCQPAGQCSSESEASGSARKGCSASRPRAMQQAGAQFVFS